MLLIKEKNNKKFGKGYPKLIPRKKSDVYNKYSCLSQKKVRDVSSVPKVTSYSQNILRALGYKLKHEHNNNLYN